MCIFLFFLFFFVKAKGGIDFCFFFQAEDGIRDGTVTGVQTCALPISPARGGAGAGYYQPFDPRSDDPDWPAHRRSGRSPNSGSGMPNGLPAPRVPERPEGGRGRRAAATRRTSAPPAGDTRREWYPAWQRARSPSELCGRVVWRSRRAWIAPDPISEAGTAGGL